MEKAGTGVRQTTSGEGKKLWVVGDLYTFLATGEDTGGAFALIECVTPPGNPGPPPHIHRREAEGFYVLEGELELTVGDTASTAGPGTFVYLPEGSLHTYRNAGDTPARFLAMISPAGLENFFEEIGEPATDPSKPPEGPPDVEKILATVPKYGVEIPPPSGG